MTMGFAASNCPHGFNDLIMKYNVILIPILLLYRLSQSSARDYLSVSLIIIKTTFRYKYERIQIIGPACGGSSNWCIEIFPTSTCMWFSNQAFLATRRTNLDVTNQPIVYEFPGSSASPFGPARPVFRSQFLHSIEVHRSMGQI